MRRRGGRRSNSKSSDHQQQQRKHILTHAARLFAELGYASTTMDMLANSTQMNKASLYYYFKNKQDILFTLLEESAQELLDLSSPALKIEPREALLHLIECGLKNLYVHSDENRIFMQELPYLAENLSRAQFGVIRQMQRQYMKIIYSVISTGMHSGEFRQGDVRIFGQMFASWTTAPIRFIGSVDLSEMIGTVAQLFMSGLCMDKYESSIPEFVAEGRPADESRAPISSNDRPWRLRRTPQGPHESTNFKSL